MQTWMLFIRNILLVEALGVCCDQFLAQRSDVIWLCFELLVAIAPARPNHLVARPPDCSDYPLIHSTHMLWDRTY